MEDNINEFINKNILKEEIVLFKVIFYIKNHGRLKYMPMKTIFFYKEHKYHLLKNTKNNDYFLDYINNKEEIHRKIFEEQLKLVEKAYISSINRNSALNNALLGVKEIVCFRGAIKSVFYGDFKKASYLSNFFMPNFSFTLKRFTTYDPDAFYLKDFKIISKDFKILRKLKTKYNFNKSNNYHLLSKEDIVLKKISTFVDFYNSKKNLRGIFLKNLLNLENSKSLKKDFEFFDLYGFRIVDKRPLHFDINFCSEYVYKLHYLLLNNIFGDNLYNKGKIIRHPLMILFPKFDLSIYTLEEMNIICFSISKSIEKRMFFSNSYYYSAQNHISDFLYFLEKSLLVNKRETIIYLSYLNNDNYLKIESNIAVFSKDKVKLNKWKMDLFLKENILLKDVIFENKKISFNNLKQKLETERLANMTFTYKNLKKLYLESFTKGISKFSETVLLNKELLNEEKVLFRVLEEDLVRNMINIKQTLEKKNYIDLLKVLILYFKYYIYDRHTLMIFCLFYNKKGNDNSYYLEEDICSSFFEKIFKEKLSLSDLYQKLFIIYDDLYPDDYL